MIDCKARGFGWSSDVEHAKYPRDGAQTLVRKRVKNENVEDSHTSKTCF